MKCLELTTAGHSGVNDMLRRAKLSLAGGHIVVLGRCGPLDNAPALVSFYGYTTAGLRKRGRATPFSFTMSLDDFVFRFED